MSVLVGVSLPRLEVLKAANQAIPAPVAIRALVDTGASCTCVDPAVMLNLGLTPTGNVQVVTAGNKPESRDQYDVALIIPSGPTDPVLILGAIPVVASNLKQDQGFDALIGRDILSQCILNYNGTMKTFTIAY
jgi:hypothetical protein